MAVSVQAQTDRQLIRSGNKQYRARNFAAAETEYRKAIGKNSLNARAVYNLGCAMLTQGNDSAAALQFQQAARMSDTKLMKARAYYNEGVAHQKRQNFGAAINAYKNALRNNPRTRTHATIWLSASVSSNSSNSNNSSRTRTTRTKIRTRTRRTNSKSKTSRRTNRNSKRSKVRRSK